jgi:biopolymer transport protein ExbD
MSLRVRRRHHKDDPTELNITAFLNLMVILVPFLLISAVFSRMTILELNIPPAPPASDNQPKKEFQLVVTIRSHSIDVGRFPEKTTASILLEPDIAYDTLVQVMDQVRVAIAVQAGSAVKVELFPDISIGDAPMLEVTSSVGGAG